MIIKPSQSEIWINCPGALNLIRDHNLYFSSSEAAEKGRKIHAYIAEKLTDKTPDPLPLESKKIGDQCIDKMIELLGDMDQKTFVVEQYIHANFEEFDIGGTPDLVMYRDNLTTIVDYKTGYAKVSADCWQLKIYATLIYKISNKAIKNIQCQIIQPTIGNYECIHYTEEDLILFDEIITRALGRLYTNKTFPGQHCKYCPAKGKCPSYNKQLSTTMNILTHVDHATNEELVELLRHKKLIEDLYKSIDKRLTHQIMLGEEIEGVKIVPKRPKRLMNSIAESAKELVKLGCHFDEIYQVKLKSPAKLKEISPEIHDYVMENSSMVSNGDKVEIDQNYYEIKKTFKNIEGRK